MGFISARHPVVIPKAYGRKDEQLYIHGSPTSRMLRSLQGDLEICVTVTLLDGLVLARSAFHHSMNYHSVVIFGSATVVDDRAAQALEALTNHVLPKRWSEVRLPTQQELDGTIVLSLPLTGASAKTRTGPPIDDEADYQLPVWAGELPFKQTLSRPILDPQLEDGTLLSLRSCTFVFWRSRATRVNARIRVWAARRAAQTRFLRMVQDLRSTSIQQ